MNDQQLLRYSRHILLDEIGIEGQQRLLDSKVLIIGLGGLGSPAALYLAAAGVGQLTLCDHDTVELSNLQRQIIHRAATVNQPKVAFQRNGRSQWAEIFGIGCCQVFHPSRVIARQYPVVRVHHAGGDLDILGRRGWNVAIHLWRGGPLVCGRKSTTGSISVHLGGKNGRVNPCGQCRRLWL